jgi:hypothetical protein
MAEAQTLTCEDRQVIRESRRSLGWRHHAMVIIDLT